MTLVHYAFLALLVGFAMVTQLPSPTGCAPGCLLIAIAGVLIVIALVLAMLGY